MPDHLHLVIMPRGENTVSFIMQEMKKSSARLVNKAEGRSGKLWLDEYYEHGIRNPEELMQKLRYMHENPVKKGLVESEEGYAFSSANPEYEEFLFREW